MTLWYRKRVSYYLVEYPVADFPRITHFGYCNGEAGRSIDEHYHLGYEIVYVKRGGAQIDLFPHSDPIPCSTDDAFITSPGVLHSFRIPHADICYYWIGIQTTENIGITSDHRIPPRSLIDRRGVSGRYLTPDHDYPELLKLGATLAVDRFAIVRNAPELYRPFESLMNEIRRKRHLQLFLIYAKLLELFVMLHRRLLPESRRTTRDALIQAVFDRVRTHYNEDLSVERLAGYVGLSPSYLSRRFASETGTHLSEYIVACRIERAKELLLHGERVGDTARKSGFASIYSFSTVFRRFVGCPPSRYRGMVSRECRTTDPAATPRVPI